MKLHHYGFATKSLHETQKEFEKLGYNTIGGEIIDEIQGVRLQFINNGCDHLIELVAPIQNDIESPVTKILQKNGSNIYHICYEVENIEETISLLKSNRYLVVLKPTPAVAFNNRRISFLYNSNVGLIEILEK